MSHCVGFVLDGPCGGACRGHGSVAGLGQTLVGLAQLARCPRLAQGLDAAPVGHGQSATRPRERELASRRGVAPLCARPREPRLGGGLFANGARCSKASALGRAHRSACHLANHAHPHWASEFQVVAKRLVGTDDCRHPSLFGHLPRGWVCHHAAQRSLAFHAFGHVF